MSGGRDMARADMARSKILREMLAERAGDARQRRPSAGAGIPEDLLPEAAALLPDGHGSCGSRGGGGRGGKFLSPVADLLGTWTMLKSSWLNLLIVAAPLALASEALGWSPSTTFLLSLAALIPLALLLGFVTEDLSLRLGETVGGLLNATFGNVVEIILSLAALQKGLYTVVSTSLLGSILSNMLMVLGMSFLLGGLKFRILRFNSLASQASSSLLLLSAISITLPTAALRLGMGGPEDEPLSGDSVLLLSRLTAVALLVVYAAYLYFQLGSHSDMFADASHGDDEDGGDGASAAGAAEAPVLSPGAASLWLAGVTLLVAACSEALTGSIEEVSHAWGLSQAFLGFIVLPIAGNACEHVTAVFVAMKNKMDLSMGVAIGSSIQIGLLAIPLVTIVGWATGHAFSLAFDPFSALVLVMSVVHTSVMIADSESNWLEGLQLIVTYFIIAVAYALTP